LAVCQRWRRGEEGGQGRWGTGWRRQPLENHPACWVCGIRGRRDGAGAVLGPTCRLPVSEVGGPARPPPICALGRCLLRVVSAPGGRPVARGPPARGPGSRQRHMGPNRTRRLHPFFWQGHLQARKRVPRGQSTAPECIRVRHPSGARPALQQGARRSA